MDKSIFSAEFIIENRVIPVEVEECGIKCITDSRKYYLQKLIEKKTGLKTQFELMPAEEFSRKLETFLYQRNGIRKENYYSTTEKLDYSAKTQNGSYIYGTVKRLLIKAYKLGASDIHIEPFAGQLTVRYRIDGILYEQDSISKYDQEAVLSHIKVMSNLDIAEKRKPQDGRVKVNLEGIDFDIRVSTIPTMYGENIALRLLNKDTHIENFSALGIAENDLTVFSRLLKFKHGMILVSGPTGSGKTTTLYTILQKLKTNDIKIATIEDPVEYEIDGINQTQINRKKDLTFANGLRSLLRQDPDILMVGEIRDLETAEIAVQSALTGHLVFSTVHTNDTVSSLIRLIDIGLPKYLIADTLRGIVAQRLVRKICPFCKNEYDSEDDRLILNKIYGKTAEGIKLNKGAGCGKCNNTGYKGRTGLYEILLLDAQIGTMLKHNETIKNIKKYAVETKGMKTLIDDGIEKISAGVTTVSELVRVAHRER